MFRLLKSYHSPQITSEHKARFVTAQAQQILNAGRSELTASCLRQALGSHFDFLLSLSEQNSCAQRWQFFDLPHTRPSDFAEQLMHWQGPEGEELWLWAGIRFRNLDLNYPFVAVEFAGSEANLKKALPQVQAHLKQSFAVFEPGGLTLLLSPDTELPESLSWNSWWVGAVSDLKERSGASECGQAAHGDAFVLIRPERPMDYERYCAQYQFWALLNSELASWVNPLSEAERQRALEQNLYFELCRVHGESQASSTSEQALEVVGVIAAEEDGFWGCDGAYMLENFVFPAFQGRGLGHLMHQLFLQQLTFSWVWGTIHADNHAALRVAEAAGRHLVQLERYLPFCVNLSLR